MGNLKNNIRHIRNKLWGLGGENHFVGQIVLTTEWQHLGFVQNDACKMLDESDGLTCFYKCGPGAFRKHVHNDSDEIIIVKQGSCVVETIEYRITLNIGDTLRIPKGDYHIFTFTDEQNLLLIHWPNYDKTWTADDNTPKT